MPKDELVMSVRIPKALTDRLDALAESLRSDADAVLLGERVSRSDVVRRAIHEGVKVLERRHVRRGDERSAK